MKKLKLVLTSLILALVLSVSVFGMLCAKETKISHASSLSSYSVSRDDMRQEIETILFEYVKITNRIPGSVGERQAAEFIKNYLSKVEGLSPKQTASVNGGVQEFLFENLINGKYDKSQNIIFEYKGNEESKQKIIIGTHYDALARNEKGEIVEAESVAGSAASVSFALAFAKALTLNNYKINVEIVFFGAGESNNAGSNFYTQGISDEQKENILLMINFDNISVGEKLYFYTEEVEDNFSKNLAKLAESQSSLIKKVNTINLCKTILQNPNELGLSYMHIAMSSDNFNFLKNGIKTLNFFAGSYSSGIVMGRQEFENHDTIAYTENDNIDYITELCGTSYITNMTELYEFLNIKFSDPNFLNELVAVQNQTNWFYAMFANQNLVIFLTVTVFVLMIIIFMLIHFKLTCKAYYANVEIEFLNSVVKICENMGGGENFDEEVPTQISKALAEDIKRDKAIRIGRKEKNKDKKDDNKSDNV